MATPSAGPYGTRIQIDGTHFGDQGALSLASSTGPVLVSSSSLQIDAGEQWQDDRIVFRYPFPAEGSITVSTPAGTVGAGSFTPSWVPGAPLNQAEDVYTPFPSTFAVSAGTVVGAIRLPQALGSLSPVEWAVMVHDGVAPALYRLATPGSGIISLVLAPESGPVPGGVALVSQAVPDAGTADGGAVYASTLMHLVWHAGVPSLEATGYRALAALGSGVDATGLFAWAEATDGSVVRLRPATPWAVDKSVAAPTGFGGGVAQTFFVGNTLALQWTVGASSGFPFFTYFEHPEFAFANASQTAWGPTQRAAGEIEGYLDGVNIQPSADGRISVVYSGGYSDVFFQAISSWASELRPVNGTFSHSPTLTGGTSFVLAPTAGGYAGAACSDSGLRVVQSVSGDVVAAGTGEVSVWPCVNRPWHPVVDTDGGVMTLFETDGRIYLVKKR